MGELTPGQRKRLHEVELKLIQARLAKAKPLPVPTQIKSIKYYLHRTIEIIRHTITQTINAIKAFLGL